MTVVLTIDKQAYSDREILPLLIKYRLLPQLAKEILIEQAIGGIDCPTADIAAARQQFCQQQQIHSEEQLQQWLQNQGKSEEDLEQQLARQQKLEKFKQQTWGSHLESYFLERKRGLDRIVYSLIRTQDAGVAQELYFRIQEGESNLPDLARQYSQGSEAQTGGLIGPIEISAPHPKIGQLLATSKPGQILPPTRIENWWVILRLEKFIGAQLDEAMRLRLLEERFQQWLREQLQTKVSLATPDGDTAPSATPSPSSATVS
ncbi:MAG: peptidylprolyl isomerase [Chloroflexaceae bacterium]|nr:peptidylprolyl isomerase [Chloroflexaceae bacterium]